MHRARLLFQARFSPSPGAPCARPTPQHHVTGIRRRHVCHYSQLATASAPSPVVELRRDDGGRRADAPYGSGAPAGFGLRRRQPTSSPTRDTVGAVIGAEDHPHVLSVRFAHIDNDVPLSKVWLRDSCRCSACVDPSSGQKSFETCDIPSTLKVREVGIGRGDSLEVLWADDFLTPGVAGHRSVYPSSLVYQPVVTAARSAESSGVSVAHTPWDRKTFQERARPIHYGDWIAGGDEFWKGFLDLAQLGLIFLRGVPDSETAVEEIANTIGHIQTTFYGKTWDVVSKPRAENVAYTNVYLGLHQDLLYVKDPPRLQLLHCLANSCEGGESLFSDGVRAAGEVMRRSPEDFELLRTTPVRYHYDKNGHWYEWSRPVVSLGEDGSGRVDSVGWAPPFQDTFPPPVVGVGGREGSSQPPEMLQRDLMEPWRAAARRFRDVASEPESMYECKMNPGDCVIFDNLRVLHGRRQFNVSSGARFLKGAYIQEQVMLSKLAQIPRHLLPDPLLPS